MSIFTNQTNCKADLLIYFSHETLLSKYDDSPTVNMSLTQ